jgi:maleate isomerase
MQLIGKGEVMALNYQLDQGFGGGARLGMIVLSTDETIENEARSIMAGRDVSLLHARIPAQPDVTPQSLAMMAQDMPQTAALLPQGMKAIAYACTSGATIIGPEKVQALVREHHPGVPVSNPISAVIAALGALNARRIGFVSPYVASVNAPMRAYLAQNDIETLAETSFAQKDDWTVARITEASTRAAILEIGKSNRVDAVFVSCTNLRTFGVIDSVEAELGVPVISSNLALIWHLLKLGQVEAKGWGPGRLFEL